MPYLSIDKRHSSGAAIFEEVPDGVQVGYKRADNNWLPPQPIEPPLIKSESPKLSSLQFKMLLHPQERIELTKRRSTDELIEDFFTILDDPRLETVDLVLKSVRDGVRYYCMTVLVGSVIESQEAAEQRINEILN